ncbi:MAG: hypothetical protein CSB55_08565 [Candidatus Cloacimonadota bacterium]|nr:MAG: hypothetical protein CSB55_08565 [Candidatus Cloacimonadota bacterium]
MKNDFSKNVLIVSSGPIIASLFSFLSEPFLARLWDPLLFGQVSFFNSLILIISPTVFLRYNFPVVQSKDDEEASNLLGLSFIIQFLIMAVIFFCYPFFDALFANRFNFVKFKFLFMSALLFNSLNVFFRQWAAYNKRFAQIPVSTIILQVSFTVLLLIFGIMGASNEVNIIRIRTISYVLCPLLMVISFFRNDFRKTLSLLNFRKILFVSEKYKKFPLIEFWGFLASLCTVNVVILLIANFWGIEINGQFSKAFYIIYVVVLLLGDSLNRVLHKEAADQARMNKPINNLLEKIVLNIHYLIFLPFVFLGVAGKEIFILLLGERWSIAGVFSQLISIWLYNMLIALAFLPVFSVLNKQKAYSGFKFLLLFSQIAILGLMYFFKQNIYISIFIFSAVSSLILILQTNYILFKADVRMTEIYKKIGITVLQTVPFLFFIIFIKVFFNLRPVAFVCIAFTALLPNIYLLYIRNKDFTNFVKLFINSRRR